MTVSATTTRSSFSGNATQGPHTISFIVLDATHIEVYWEKGASGPGTPITGGGFTAGASGYLKKDTHYTVQNAGTSSNATITYIEAGFTVDSTVTYPTSVDTIVITRSVPLTQVSDYTNNSTIDAETIENSFDKLTQISQQLDDNAGHSLKLSSALEGTTGFNTTPSEASTISQNKADRLNNIVSFDSNGDIIATQEIGSWQGNWVAATTYVERDLVKNSETGAVYICLEGHEAVTFTTDLSASRWEAIIDAGGFNVKLTANVTVDTGEKLITPYKLDLNGYTLINNGTVICAEIITGDGTVTGSNGVTESGPINLTDAGVATLAGEETFTNKTLTAPEIADAGFIADANGAEQLVFQTTASAENHFEMTNAADSNSPQLAALGDDTNVGMILNTKGTGSYELKVGGTLALTIALSGGNTTITGP